MAILLVALTLCVAFANGANDISKGIATLVGSGVGSYRRAMTWGVGWALVGALAAALVSQGFVPVFSGRGILVTPPAGLAFPVAVTCAPWASRWRPLRCWRSRSCSRYSRPCASSSAA